MNERVAVFEYVDLEGNRGTWRVSCHPNDTEADMRTHAVHFRPNIKIISITFQQQEDDELK